MIGADKVGSLVAAPFVKREGPAALHLIAKITSRAGVGLLIARFFVGRLPVKGLANGAPIGRHGLGVTAGARRQLIAAECFARPPCEHMHTPFAIH
jgi:hypothetical protein